MKQANNLFTYLIGIFFALFLCSVSVYGQKIILLEDFGATYSDEIDDTQAFKNALSSVASSSEDGVVIKLSEGTLILNGVIDMPDYLTFEGRGMDKTKLKWVSAGGLTNVNASKGSPEGLIELRDLSIVAGVPNAGTGLWVYAKGSTSIRFVMNRVKFGHEDGGYWNNCFIGDTISYTQLTDCEFYGDYENTDYLMQVRGFAIASRFLNSKFSGAQNAMLYTGSMEGTFIVGNEMSNVKTGIVRKLGSETGGSEPLFDIINNKITASKYCIDVRGISSSNIADNTLIVDAASDDDDCHGVYINGTNIERNISITDNLIINRGNPNERSGVYVTDFDYGYVISKNNIVNFKTGIELIKSNNGLVGENLLTDIGTTTSNAYSFKSMSKLYVSKLPNANAIQCISTCPCQASIKSIRASAYKDEATIPSNAIDCDSLSSWTVNGKGNYITFELHQKKLVSGVQIAFAEGNARTADIEILISKNGVNFISKGSYTSSGTTSGYELFSLAQDSSSFVKIIANGNSSDDWNSFSGVRIMVDGNIECCEDSVGLGSPKINDGYNKQERNFSVYPNPVEGNNLCIAYLSDSEGIIYQITNISGQLMHESILPGNNGWSISELDITKLDTGIYIVSINGFTSTFIRQ